MSECKRSKKFSLTLIPFEWSQKDYFFESMLKKTFGTFTREGWKLQTDDDFYDSAKSQIIFLMTTSPEDGNNINWSVKLLLQYWNISHHKFLSLSNCDKLPEFMMSLLMMLVLFSILSAKFDLRLWILLIFSHENPSF